MHNICKCTHRRSGMMVLVRVTMPLTATSVSMCRGSRSRMGLTSDAINEWKRTYRQ